MSNHSAINHNQHIAEYPLLTVDEEKQLAWQLRNGSKQERANARQRFVLCNTRLVLSVANRYVGRGMELDDLVQEGFGGLLRAVDLFDPQRGNRFSTYAVWWIRQAITRSLLDTVSEIRVPVSAQQFLPRALQTFHDLTQARGVAPDVREVGELVGISPDRLQSMLNALLPALPLDREMGEGNEAELYDLVADDAVVDGGDVADAGITGVVLRELLDQMPAREAFVLRQRFGIEDNQPQTLTEIAKTLGVSRERVRQIEKESLSRLRILCAGTVLEKEKK